MLAQEGKINMHHLHEAMQYRQTPWTILSKFCVVGGFLFPKSSILWSKIVTLSVQKYGLR